MNHYPRHIGDYLKDTAHLTLLEHGVYTRLLDVYYTREGAIPEDQAARLVGARSKDERDALQAVLSEFFALEDGQWRQKRADAEIARYLEKAERNREVGKKGGRPRTQPEPTNNPDGFRQETQGEPTDNPSHKPVASSHNQKETSSASDLTTVAHATPESAAPPAGAEVRELPKPDRATLIAIYLRKQGIAIQAAHPLAQQWQAQGVTDDHLAEAVAIARMRKPTGPIAPGYLAPILAEAMEPRRDTTGKTLSQLLAERDAEEAAEAARQAATGAAHASH